MKEDFMSRRAFFKKVVKKTLPILVGVSALPTIISCVREDDDLLEALDRAEGGNTGCTGSSCSYSCTGSSKSTSCTSCSSSCLESCVNSCSNNCSSTCKNLSSSSGGNGNHEISDASGTIDGYEYVDLGLSVKWARYNIGASKPDSYGSYLYSNIACSDSNGWDKLVNAGFWGENKSTSGTSFDMAISKWSNKWRMPTKEDFTELINNCTITFIEHNNCKGYLFTSKKNGKSLFFAAAGEKWYYKGVWEDNNIGFWGVYWSGDVHISASYNAAGCLRCTNNSKTGEISAKIYDQDMYDNKFTIRPVSNSGGASSGCNGTCTASCANTSTSSGCSSCGSNCSGSCKTQCDYNCAATCVSHCYGSCNDTCGGGCKYLSAGSSCSGCASTCSGRCYHACSYACSSNCQSSCVNGSK